MTKHKNDYVHNQSVISIIYYTILYTKWDYYLACVFNLFSRSHCSGNVINNEMYSQLPTVVQFTETADSFDHNYGDYFTRWAAGDLMILGTNPFSATVSLTGKTSCALWYIEHKVRKVQS